MESNGSVDRRAFVRKAFGQAAAAAMTVLDARRELAAAGTAMLLGDGGSPVHGHVVGDSAEECQPAERAYRVEPDGTIVIVDRSIADSHWHRWSCMRSLGRRTR